MEETTVDLKVLFDVILSRMKWIICSTILGIIIAVVVTQYLLTPQYSSSVMLVVKADTEEKNITVNELNTAQRLVNTYIIVLKDDDVLDEVIDTLDIEITTKKLRSMIKLSPIDNSEILQIEAQTESPELSAKICNTLVQIAPRKLEEIVNAGFVKPVGVAKIMKDPTFPNKTSAMIIGALAGLIFSVIVILLIYFLDNTVKAGDDVQNRFGIPVLGEIPSFTLQSKNGGYSYYGKR